MSLAFERRAKLSKKGTVKIFMLVFSSAALISCVSYSPIKNTWHSDLVGQELYVKYPPTRFGNQALNEKGNDLVTDFDKCKPFKVVSFSKWLGQLYFNVEQNNKIFKIDTHTSVDDPKEELMKKFSTSLPFKDRTIKTTDGKESSKKLICAGTMFMGMQEDEFLFILGKPNDINTTAVNGLVRKQYVYGSKYYYFDNGKLTGWQN